MTIELPADLVERACRSSGEDLAATIRRGLERPASASTQRDLTAWRGKVKVSLDLDDSRTD